MSTRRPGLTAFGVALGLVCYAGATARAQHTPDPYNIVGEYNQQYEPFMYANVPTTPGILPNQYRLAMPPSGLANANRFQEFLGSEGDFESDLRRPSTSRLPGPGVPYFRANRRYDEEFQRNYRPNDVADRSFYALQQQRNAKYFEALREPDPRKRAQLLREYNLENLRAARSLSANRNSPEREFSGDRLPSGGLVPEDDLNVPAARRPAGRNAAPARPLGTAPPPPAATGVRTRPTAPGARAPLGATAPAGTTGARARPLLNRPRAPAPPPPRGTRSVTDLLERSESMEPASRTVSPTPPPP